jgi:hypothetical protein
MGGWTLEIKGGPRREGEKGKHRRISSLLFLGVIFKGVVG